MRWLIGLAFPAVLFAGDAAPVTGALLSCDAWPRAVDLRTWTGDVLRISGTAQGTETAQGKAFFEWLRLFNRMAVGGMIQAYEGPYGKEAYVLDAHKTLFVYGWGYCDTTSRIAVAAWREYKQDPQAADRVITQHDDGGYHTMYRLRMDGGHGAFDPRYGYYLVEKDAPDARILDWKEVGDDAQFLKNKGYANRSKPYFEIWGVEWERALLLQPGWFDSEAQWRAAGAPKETVFGDSQYKMGTKFHDMSFTLWRGTTIERHWDNSARKFYRPAGKHTEREKPFLPAGRFYRVTEKSLDGNWPKHDPNYQRARAYLSVVPRGEGYEGEGEKSIGQAWGVLRYRPILGKSEGLDAVLPGRSLTQAGTAPFLRPAKPEEGGEAVFDFRCPYVLVDGTLEVELAGAGARMEMRTLGAKRLSAQEADAWSEWEVVAQGAGRHSVELGRPRFDGKRKSIHGLYRFQVRMVVDAEQQRKTAAGLSGLKLDLIFENGIMSIPQIFAGRNTMRFRVGAAAQLQKAVEVEYRYQSEAGAKSVKHVLNPGDFKGNEGVWTMDAPGLLRCDSVSVSY
ncbi:MAG: hypothetical protein HY821_08415 [Acidobacteria bacterium]|nr:hypothetical protein [Acidobacteriota bacterium]